MLLHGIMSRSPSSTAATSPTRSSRASIQKAKSGGTPGRAPTRLPQRPAHRRRPRDPHRRGRPDRAPAHPAGPSSSTPPASTPSTISQHDLTARRPTRPRPHRSSPPSRSRCRSSHRCCATATTSASSPTAASEYPGRHRAAGQPRTVRPGAARPRRARPAQRSEAPPPPALPARTHDCAPLRRRAWRTARPRIRPAAQSRTTSAVDATRRQAATCPTCRLRPTSRRLERNWPLHVHLGLDPTPELSESNCARSWPATGRQAGDRLRSPRRRLARLDQRAAQTRRDGLRRRHPARPAQERAGPHQNRPRADTAAETLLATDIVDAEVQIKIGAALKEARFFNSSMRDAVGYDQRVGR